MVPQTGVSVGVSACAGRPESGRIALFLRVDGAEGLSAPVEAGVVLVELVDQ